MTIVRRGNALAEGLDHDEDIGVRAAGVARHTTERVDDVISRQAAQRVEIETKLNALFKALDNPPRRAEGPTVVALADEPRRTDHLLGKTAISPSWRLEKAVAEVAERQAFLERQSGGEGGRIPPARPSPAERAARIEEEARAAAPASVFTALQDDVARVSGRLDRVTVDLQKPAPSRGTSFDEIRALLDEMRPDASIDTLGKHVETLSLKLDKVVDHRVSPETVDRLSQRIEQIHAEVATRLSVPAAPAIDMSAVEEMVREVMERSDPSGRWSADLRSLGEAVHEVAARLDQAQRSPDGAALNDLQVQVADLAARIDRSDERHDGALGAMEHALREMGSALSEVHSSAIETAETTARAVAEDVAQSALAERAHLATTDDQAVAQVTEELAAMRASRIESDKRLHAILAALNNSLDRVVDRLGVLENDAEGRAGASRHDAETAPADLVPAERERLVVSPPAMTIGLHAAVQPQRDIPLDLDSPVPADAELAVTPAAVAPVTPSAPMAPPISFGSGADAPAQDAPIITPDPANFIAAARRAAQAAAQEQVMRLDGSAVSPAARVAAAPPRRLKIADSSRRRPLLLAIASLILLMGAAQIVRMTLKTDQPPATTGEVAAVPTNSDAAAPSSAPAPAATASTDKAPTATADAAPTTPAASSDKPAAAPAAAAAPTARPNLPTMAMGPGASIAAVKVAETQARAAATAAAGAIPAGLLEQATDGHADAQFEVGLRYADGRGVARDLPAAANWFEKAAKQGLAPAAYRLGSLYERGLGVPRDAAQAISWYKKAAEAGHVRAAHNLAVLLAEGAAGKPDYAAAASWFTKAAEAGVKDSQYNLGILYARGLGVEQNLAKSYTWFAIAAAQGDTDSSKKMGDVAGRLDAAALAEAKAKAAAFKPVPTLASANEVPAPAGGWDALTPARASTSALPARSDTARVSSR